MSAASARPDEIIAALGRDLERAWDERDALRVENRRLRQALKRHGKHDSYRCATGACECGFSEALLAGGDRGYAS